MEPKKRGRPKKFIDLELVEKMAHIQCTYNEIAYALGVSKDTLLRNKHFVEVCRKGSEGGKKSLRRMQFESANRGNVTMQIWLGKQYLDQSDQMKKEIRHDVSLFELNPEELNQLLRRELAQIGYLPEFADFDLSTLLPAPGPCINITPRKAVRAGTPADKEE